MSENRPKYWSAYCEFVAQEADLFSELIGIPNGRHDMFWKQGRRSCSCRGNDGCPVQDGSRLSDWSPCPFLCVVPPQDTDGPPTC